MSSKFDLRLDWATHEAAKYACTHWHYSKCVPAGKLVKIGVWERDVFKGVILFSRGANSDLGSPYGLSQYECCELSRIALDSHISNVSRMMSVSLSYLKKQSPSMRLVISFADTEQKHHGGIYQAANWTYSGMSKSADEYVVFGKRMHGRSMRAKFGSHLGKGFIKQINGSRKHRYLMPLDKETAEQIKPLAQQYPKREKQAMDSFPESQRQGSTDLHAP